ncbi:MAG: cytochrome c oxidase accessory protein CcoG [Leptospiraceae bacterium]|nr:cytochrome c oxidase accessory protein CcoG [Leptospiraceae bacterium]MDW7976996.1 cytochrome c oxidase accessory protein CcoG [Leptospiraceae bacterium]
MVIARPINGRHRKIKDKIKIVLFAIFFILPFIRIDGIPLILLDIPARKFYVFGFIIWPQEMYFLHIILLFLGFSLFFWTALAGRLWCGYACPQTLFTEVYDSVARRIIGDRFGKPSMKKTDWFIVYIVWFIMSIIFNFVFLSYFKPFEETIHQVINLDFFVPTTYFPQNWVIYMVLGTGTAMFNMVYFRENLCRLVCPYGRFQVALLDKHSPIVTYDIKRGEPRKQPGQKVGQHKGDCIDCKLCILVCPTGIDIREGLQVGCLHCGLCVDACTNVMGRFNKETLISYKTIDQVENPNSKVKYLRTRTVVYGTILIVLLTAFIYLLATRVPIYTSALRDKEISNIYIPGIGWRNGYEIHIGNLSFDPLDVEIDVVSDYNFIVLSGAKELQIKPEGYEKIRYIIEYSENQKKPNVSSVPLTFVIKDKNHPKHVKKVKTYFTFPIN